MRDRTPYSSDLSDREWQILEPLLPAEKPGGRHRAYPMREILNAIQYVLRSGCAWRSVPHDLPHWETAIIIFSGGRKTAPGSKSMISCTRSFGSGWDEKASRARRSLIHSRLKRRKKGAPWLRRGEENKRAETACRG